MFALRLSGGTGRLVTCVPLCGFFLACSSAGSLTAQVVTAAAEVTAPAPAPAEPPAALDRLLRQIVLEALPREHQDTRQWGKTRQVLDGWRVHREGGRLQVEKRKKPVNHGSWQLYRVQLVEPEKNLSLGWKNAREAPGGGLRIDFEAIADVDVFARYSEWRYDVQLISLSSQSRARVRFAAICDVRLQLDPSRLPPDFLVVPQVQTAQVDLLDYDLLQLSDIKGAAAHELGKAARLILDKLLEEKQDELPAKINRQIAKQQDRLRLSLPDAATSFWRQAGAPEPVAQP